jgi:hypothetical protein
VSWQAENSEVPDALFVAVDVTISPAPTGAGTVAWMIASPRASVVTSVCPRYVRPSP